MKELWVDKILGMSATLKPRIFPLHMLLKDVKIVDKKL
jgi:hypothetical protein